MASLAVDPSRAQARKMVLVGVGLFAAVQFYKARKDQGGIGYKQAWGIGVVGLVLSVTADFAPSIAGPFAVLLALGALTDSGAGVIDAALGKVSAGASTTHPTRSGGESPGGPQRGR